MLRSLYCYAMGTAVMAAAVPQATAADVALPTALASLKPGQWQLQPVTAGTPAKTLCLGDPRILLQLRHGTLSCNRFVITNEPSHAVVHYACGAGGNGRTSIRVETPRVIQIESQGIVNSSPFEIAYEARRIGDCPETKQTERR